MGENNSGFLKKRKKVMMRLSILSLFTGIIILLVNYEIFFLIHPASSPEDIKIVSPVRKIDLATLLFLKNHTSCLLVDLRTVQQFGLGRIPAAINIPPEIFANMPREMIERLKKFENIIIYEAMESGQVSRDFTTTVSRYGIENIKVFNPGWAQWKSCRLEVEK